VQAGHQTDQILSTFPETPDKIQVLELLLPMVEEQVPDIPTVLQAQAVLHKLPHMSITDSAAVVAAVVVAQKANGQAREKVSKVLD
jgi:hypothetical protein